MVGKCMCAFCLLNSLLDSEFSDRLFVGERFPVTDELEVIVRVNPDFQAKREREPLQAFAAVMGTIARVLYVRAELRFSKGHAPFGKGLASGEVWDKEEIAEAMCRVRYDLQLMLGEPLIKPRG